MFFEGFSDLGSKLKPLPSSSSALCLDLVECLTPLPYIRFLRHWKSSLCFLFRWKTVTFNCVVGRHPWLEMPKEASGIASIVWYCSHRQLNCPSRCWELNSGPLLRAADALTHWTSSPAFPTGGFQSLFGYHCASKVRPSGWVHRERKYVINSLMPCFKNVVRGKLYTQDNHGNLCLMVNIFTEVTEYFSPYRNQFTL